MYLLVNLISFFFFSKYCIGVDDLSEPDSKNISIEEIIDSNINSEKKYIEDEQFSHQSVFFVDLPILFLPKSKMELYFPGNLTVLNLSLNDFTENLFSDIALNANLKKLKIDIQIGNNAQSTELCKYNLINEYLVPLCRLENLKSLTIVGHNAIKIDTSFLNGFKNLKYLRLVGLNLSSLSINKMIRTLEMLDLSNNNFIDFEWLKYTANLKVILLRENKIKFYEVTKFFYQLTNNKKKMELDLSNNLLRNDHIMMIKKNISNPQKQLKIKF